MTTSCRDAELSTDRQIAFPSTGSPTVCTGFDRNRNPRWMRPFDLPAGLRAGPFTTVTARDFGMSRHVMTGLRIQRVVHGVHEITSAARSPMETGFDGSSELRRWPPLTR